MSFLSRTIFIRTFGIEYLGLNGIFVDVLSLLSMADLGFNTTMAYSFYKPLAEHDEKKLTALICFYKRVYNIIFMAVTVIGICAIPFLKFIINTEKEIPHMIIYYLFSLSGVAISYLFVYRSIILTADQKNYEVLRVSIWTTLLKAILQIMTLLLWKNYIIYLLIGIMIQLSNNLFISRKTNRIYPYIKNREQISPEEEKNIFKNMKSIFLYKVSTIIFNSTDNVLISYIIGTAMVGLYSNYLMISNKLLLIIQIIFSALMASIGNLIVKEGTKKRYEIFSALQSVSFILCGIITSLFCIMGNDFVNVWLGLEFTVSRSNVLVMTMNTYLSCVLLPLWTYRDATGLYMKTKFIMLMGAILNIVLSIVMGHWWGLTGIVFATVVSRLFTYVWYEPKILFKEYFDYSVKGYYLSLLKNALLVLINIKLLSWLFRGMNVDGWLMLITKGVIVGLASTIIFLCFYAHTEGFQLIVTKLNSGIRNVIRIHGGNNTC